MIKGLVRSMAVYYGIPLRTRRMVALYRHFLRPGDLAFDVGAHVGNRLRAWRKIGVRAVGIEPQPDCLKVLNRLYGRDEHITIVPQAVGAEPGSAVLQICRAFPTLSTLSQEWIATVKKAEIFAGITWDDTVAVKVTTLDALIAQYGTPRFIKIDVEGFEHAVLSGLTQPIAALSFEFLPADIAVAVHCVDRLSQLGAYQFNLSPVETMRFVHPQWVTAADIRGTLAALGRNDRSGDVYARLVG